MFSARLLFALALTLVISLFPLAPRAHPMGVDADGRGQGILASAGAGVIDTLLAQADLPAETGSNAVADGDSMRLAPCHDPDSPNGCTLAPTCASSCLAATLSDAPEVITHLSPMTEAGHDPGQVGLSHIPAIRPPISLI